MSTSYFKDIYNYLSQKYPNKKVYVISDQHFYHEKIITYSRCEFKTVEEMNQHIIINHNQVVNPDDIVIFLGDFCFKRGMTKNIIEQLNGHIFLILGNHDYDNMFKKWYNLGFEEVFLVPVKFQDAYLSHYPLCDMKQENIHYELLAREFEKQKNGINYHGHIHQFEDKGTQYCNVSCEMVKYQPILIGTTGPSNDNKPLFLTSDNFTEAVKFIQAEKGIDSCLLIKDYIYTTMLESLTNFFRQYYVYGSFALYKKYGYMSNFSDIDIGIIYDEGLSANKNIEIIKTITDTVFNYFRDIPGIDLEMLKRYINLCEFYCSYSNGTNLYAKAAFDANALAIDFHNIGDFETYYGLSSIEKMLQKEAPDIIADYHLPNFKSQFLVFEGNLTNLILQILFQNGYEEAIAAATKKIRYLIRQDTYDREKLEDIIIRLFLKNILFFHSLRRRDDIKYIQQSKIDISPLITNMPGNFKAAMEEIFQNPNSEFSMVFNEISKVNMKDIPKVTKELIKVRKK